MHEFYSSDLFEKEFTYTGTDLGFSWTREKTTFRLWAPTADLASVRLYRSGTEGSDDLIRTAPMTRDVYGTWVAIVEGDLNGIYYTYQVKVNGQISEACDPYARTTGVNGKRAMVLDLSATNPHGWECDQGIFQGNITDAIIYEMHIRDASMHRSSHIHCKGKFLGLTETGTKTAGGNATGLDHIKQLGITHLHLLPVYDFGSVDESRPELKEFNWGYDPVNFNVPEGSYSTDPYHGEVRVREMKQMVKALHDNGINVVMDVVYNHVYKWDEFCFNKLVPGYFSRISPSGRMSNGSCCGNDTASERSMVRKYIVDSVLYWADEYHIDGFRFDLVGLIDIQTIQEVMAAVHRAHPHVIFYGEGWSMNTNPTKPGIMLNTQNNSSQVPGFAFFSDTIRDLLRGSIFDNTLPGYVTGEHCAKDALEACFMGIPHWAASPEQCVNYVSCHDNNTLIDRIALAASHIPFEEQIKMNRLAAAFTILSQGVPFMQAGEDFLRSKPLKNNKYDENSYRSPDRVNAIRWELLDKEDYQKTFRYYQGLIRFRKDHPALRLSSREDVCNHVKPILCQNPHTVAFLIEDEEEQIFAAFNADDQAVSLTLPEGEWKVNIQDDTAGTEEITALSGSVAVFSRTALVLTQKRAAKPVDVVAALIWEKDKFLICQRPATKARGLLWEFVGGKVEPGETMAQALVRECQEELGITIDVGKQFMQVIHAYPDILIRLTLFHSTIPEGFPQALEHNDIRWIHPREIDQYAFCPADADILLELKRLYGKKEPL